MADEGKRLTPASVTLPHNVDVVQMAGTVLPFISRALHREARARRDLDRSHRIRHAQSLGIPQSQIAVWCLEREDEQARAAHYAVRVGFTVDAARGQLLTSDYWT